MLDFWNFERFWLLRQGMHFSQGQPDDLWLIWVTGSLGHDKMFCNSDIDRYKVSIERKSWKSSLGCISLIFLLSLNQPDDHIVTSVQTFDFSTVYTSTDPWVIAKMNMSQCFELPKDGDFDLCSNQFLKTHRMFIPLYCKYWWLYQKCFTDLRYLC